MRYKEFFEYAKKREAIRIAKAEGKPKPWADDHILQNYRFCNVFREDDKTTKWIREHITPEAYGDHFVGAMVIARWFNRIETLEILFDNAMDTDMFINWKWVGLEEWKYLMQEFLGGVKPLVTGAYMVKTPPKMNKLDGVLWALERFLPHAVELQKQLEGVSLQSATEMLQEFPHMGPFTSYEVITDLRHTLLSDAPDIMTWANPGPGCARGLCRMMNAPLHFLQRGCKKDVGEMQILMQLLSERTWQTTLMVCNDG